MGVIGRGLAAGAVGVTALNTVSWLDMAVRARAASDTPQQVVDAVAERLGQSVPGSRGERANRRSALGSLVGIASGLAVGVGASAARAAGIRLPGPLAAVATGAAAMAAADLPTSLLGLNDPRDWTAGEWLADAAPHLAFGLAAHAVLGLDAVAVDSPASVQVRPSAGLVLRSLLLGAAAGSRSSLGLAGPALTARPRGLTPTSRPRGVAGTVVGLAGSRVAALAVAGELVVDKLPQTPSRTEPPALAIRLGSGGSGAIALARRRHARVVLPMLAGIGGAAAGSFGGAAWRSRSARVRPDWQGALIEDGVALLLTALACLPGRRPA